MLKQITRHKKIYSALNPSSIFDFCQVMIFIFKYLNGRHEFIVLKNI